MTVHIPLYPYLRDHKCFMRVTGRKWFDSDEGEMEWITFECDHPDCGKGGAALPWVFTRGRFE